MKMDLASAVLLDLKKKKAKGGESKEEPKSRGARLLEAIKDDDADAIDAILDEE